MLLPAPLMRAGFAFLIFGTFAAALPNDSAAFACCCDCSCCPSGAATRSSYDAVQDAAYISGGAVAASYLITRGGTGGIFPHRKKHQNNGPYTVYPTSAPVPAASQPTAAAPAPAPVPVAQTARQNQSLQNYLNSGQML